MDHPFPAVFPLQPQGMAARGPVPACLQEGSSSSGMQEKFPKNSVLLLLALQDVSGNVAVGETFAPFPVQTPVPGGKQGINKAFPVHNPSTLSLQPAFPTDSQMNFDLMAIIVSKAFFCFRDDVLFGPTCMKGVSSFEIEVAGIKP